MLLNGKIIDSIREDDLLALIGIEEDKTIDFKGHGYHYREGNDNRWKAELCIDVSSLANAGGGWIICGMEEEAGIATQLLGLGELNPDLERRRLEQCINNGVEPRLLGLQTEFVDLPKTGKGKAILIYVPRSLTAPHRVKETRKFHIRRSNWNDEMNIDEVRTAFNLSETVVDRIKEFRRQRIETLSSDGDDDIPILLTDGVRMALHVVPLAFSDPSFNVDLSTLRSRNPPRWVYQTDFGSGHHNLDGYIRPNGNHSSTTRLGGYVQVYRNGAIEAVEIGNTQQAGERTLTFLASIEDFARTYLELSLAVQQNLGVEPPLVTMLSLVKVRGLVLFPYWGARTDPFHPYTPLKRDKILLPDTVITDYPDDIPSALKPIFDVLWNTGGWARSLSYDESGNWTQRDT